MLEALGRAQDLDAFLRLAEDPQQGTTIRTRLVAEINALRAHDGEPGQAVGILVSELALRFSGNAANQTEVE